MEEAAVGRIVKSSEMEERGSKTLIASQPMREPNWLVWTLMKLGRLVFLTVLWTCLGMGAGLFAGIFAVLVGSALRHQPPNLADAYRLVAVPLALCTGGGAFVWNLGRTVQAAVKRARGKRP